MEAEAGLVTAMCPADGDTIPARARSQGRGDPAPQG
jgi:hypothetical protein